MIGEETDAMSQAVGLCCHQPRFERPTIAQDSAKPIEMIV